MRRHGQAWAVPPRSRPGPCWKWYKEGGSRSDQTNEDAWEETWTFIENGVRPEDTIPSVLEGAHTTKGFLSSILDGIPERVLLQDREHRINWANKRALEAIGRTRDEVLGAKCHVLLMGSNAPCTDCPVEKAFSTCEPSDFDITLHGGSRYHLWAYPVKPRSGRAEQVLVIVRDITVSELELKAIEAAEEKYRSLIESSPDMVFVIDGDGTIHYANAPDTMAGSENRIGNNLLDYITPDDPEEVQRMIDRVFGSGEPGSFEAWGLDYDRNETYFHVGLNPIRRGGSVDAIHLIARDITWESEAIKMISESEQRFHTVFRESATGILIVDSIGRIHECNPTFERFLGFSREELVGRSFTELTHPDDRPMDQQLFRRMSSRGKDRIDVKKRLMAKDGSILWCSMNIIPNATEESEHDYGIVLVEDTNHRERQVDGLWNLFDLTSDLLCIVDPSDVTILRANPALSAVSEHDERELLCKRLTDLIHPNDVPRVLHYIQRIQEAGHSPGHLQSRLLTKGGAFRWVEWSAGHSKSTGHVYLVGSDVTEKKRAEQEVKRRQMEFKLEDGHVYLVSETEHHLSHRAFKDLVEVGYDGVVFYRTPSPYLEDMPEGKVQHHWLAMSKNGTSLSPDLQSLREVLMDLPPRQAVLIDRLDYIISHNGFRDTLSFVHYLRELTYLNDSITIITIDAGTVSDRQLRLLDKECSELQPMHASLLEDDLFDVLRVVQKHDLMKVGTTYSDLTTELGISKPTARKRVHSLKYFGYLVEVKRGKKKTFTMTEKGWNLMSR